MATRLQVILDAAERSALIELAQRERRNPRDQAALLIRHELQKRGLLPGDAKAGDPGRGVSNGRKS